MQTVVSPFQGLVFVIIVTQGGAARLAPLRSALGGCVEAPSGRRVVRLETGSAVVSFSSRRCPPGSRAVATVGAALRSGTRNPWEGVPFIVLAPGGAMDCSCLACIHNSLVVPEKAVYATARYLSQ